MKKCIPIVLFTLLAGSTISAQDSPFYGRVGVGGGIGLCYYDPCDFLYNEEYFFPDYDRLESVGFDPGTGFNLNLAAGYRINDHMAAELVLKDFFGLNVKSVYNAQGEGGSNWNEIRLHGMMFQVVPSFVLNAGMEKLDPYARFGLIIGAVSRVYLKEEQKNNDDTWNYEGVYKGGLPLGFSAALGVNYSLNDRFNVFAELNCNGVNYSPKKYELTLYERNGEDLLGNLTTSQKEIEFVRDYDALDPSQSSDPEKRLKESFPFSNVELNLGVELRF